MNKTIAIVGGGRWARVLCEVLIELLPKSTQISMHTQRNFEAMSKWVRERDFSSQVSIFEDNPGRTSPKPFAAIVANAASDHANAALYLIAQRIPVLIEKPMTLTLESARELVNLAVEAGTPIAPALVFRYASYVENFAHLLRQKSIAPKCINVFWTDPKSEVRHNEVKRFDHSIPVFVDCLPHVFSITETIMPGSTATAKLKCVACQELSANLDFTLDKISLRIELLREGSRRLRLIEVETDSGVHQLDFSTEPGIITFDGLSVSADSDWASTQKLRPLATMVKSFIECLSSDQMDPRLKVSFALEIQRVIDEVQNFSAKSTQC